jgi:hypothetical protein
MKQAIIYFKMYIPGCCGWIYGEGCMVIDGIEKREEKYLQVICASPPAHKTVMHDHALPARTGIA